MSEEGFLRRWARRKTETRDGRTPGPEPASGTAPASGPAAATAAADASGLAPAMPAAFAPGGHAAHPATGTPPDSARGATPAGAGIRLPTMDDVARLTPESDYSAFVARGVDAAVRRSALKKLFSDPHFNAIDRLDVYMDDYTKASPLAEGMLESLQHSKSLFARAAEDAQARLDAEAAAQRACDAAAGMPAASTAPPVAAELEAEAADPHPATPAPCAPTVRPETPALSDNGNADDDGAGIRIQAQPVPEPDQVPAHVPAHMPGQVPAQEQQP